MKTPNKIAIFSAKKAVSDYNSKLTKFQEMYSRMKVNQPPAMENPPMMNLGTMLGQSGQPANFVARENIAKQFGINGYSGAKHQDEQIMMGMQGKQMNDGMKSQQANEKSAQEKEYGFKDRELSLKEKEIDNNKPVPPPTADDIAHSLMSKYT